MASLTSSTYGQAMPVIMAAMTEREKVAAIDLGTTFSGCAFADREEILNDPEKITVVDLNGNASRRLISQKTPTSILFDTDMKFMAFGHDAEEQYAQLQCEGKEWGVYMFKWFKMMLYHEQKLSKNTKIIDVCGRPFAAFDVFSQCLAFLRQKLLQDIKVDDSRIHWVLTVPAIWSENAKQFMRQTALKAGFNSERLSLALEPEAASIFCKNIPRIKILSAGTNEVDRFSSGDKYIVLDIGGGTTDITVHEILKNGNIKELVSANGGDWGGRSIDKAFENLLEYLIGADVMEIIDNRFAEDKFRLHQEFEITKRTVGSTRTGWVKIKLPQVIFEQFQEMNKESLDSINGTDKCQDGTIQIKSDNLLIDAERFKKLFKPTSDHIMERVRCIRMELNDDDLKKILLVGGFGESTLIHEELQRNFPDMTIIVPEDAGLAVLKGAVLFGFNQGLINYRVCRKTYGIQTYKHFEPAMDSPDRRLVIGRTVLCKNSFDIHAHKNEVFEVDEFAQIHEYVPSDPGKQTMSLNVLASDEEWPRYADSPGVDTIGQILIKLEDSDVNNPKPIEVQMQFGRTELGVVAKEKHTGKETKATYNFLEHNSA